MLNATFPARMALGKLEKFTWALELSIEPSCFCTTN
jgi:hypothetical protein